MSGLDFFRIWCQDNYVNPGRPGSAQERRAWRLYQGFPEPDLSQLDFGDGRDPTFADIVALTGDAPGTTMAVCPECFPDYYRRQRKQENDEDDNTDRNADAFDLTRLNEPEPKRCLKIVRNSYRTATYSCRYCDEEADPITVALDGEPSPKIEAEWNARQRQVEQEERGERIDNALKIWGQGTSIIGTRAQQYLQRRGITELPPNVDEVLRFHPQCPFGLDKLRRRRETQVLLALYRDPVTGKPIGIHRTALPGEWRPGINVERMELGPQGAIQLWPLAGDALVIGEGIETVLSAAQAFRLPNGDPLRPAWALGSANNLRFFPVLPSVKRLVILVDNDRNGVGQLQALRCQRTWEELPSNRVLKLTPRQPGFDFNDVLMDDIARGRR
jgi:hypothetical protein